MRASAPAMGRTTATQAATGTARAKAARFLAIRGRFVAKIRKPTRNSHERAHAARSVGFSVSWVISRRIGAL